MELHAPSQAKASITHTKAQKMEKGKGTRYSKTRGRGRWTVWKKKKGFTDCHYNSSPTSHSASRLVPLFLG